MGKFYVVWNGVHPGVYDNWDDAREQITNYPGALYKSYPSAESAAAAYRKGYERTEKAELSNLLDNAGRHRPHTRSSAPDWRTNPEIDMNAWAVDAACSGNPGNVEYRGVELATGRQLFHVGPIPEGTNNLGEFLAIVHALALMEKSGDWHPIYSDSVSGMAWVRNRIIKTTLPETPANARLFDMLRRAIAWLNTHTYPVAVMKWDTPRWGEIPADFGRK